jgi:hypothetical protein
VYLIKEVPLVDGKLENRQVLVAVAAAVAQLSKNGKRGKKRVVMRRLMFWVLTLLTLLLSSLRGEE